MYTYIRICDRLKEHLEVNYLLFMTIDGCIAVESSITSKEFYIPETVWIASRRVPNQ
jgi:hypothetical protein